MTYSRDFSKAPATARADAIFYGGTQYAGIRSMLGLYRHWRRVRDTMKHADGYLGHHIWYRFPFTFGMVTFFETQQQMMVFAKSIQHRAAERWMYMPGVADGAFFRILTPGPVGYTYGLWSADDLNTAGHTTPTSDTHSRTTAAISQQSVALDSPNGTGTKATSEARTTVSGHGGNISTRILMAPMETVLRVPRLRATLDELGKDRLPARVVQELGTKRAERAVHRASQAVPALRDFYTQAGPETETVRIGRLEVPITNKQNYVQRYSLAARCVDGRIPARGVTVDESSGSSGIPSNWVRSSAERRLVQANIASYVRTWLGNEPYITLNAFSLGAWATGLNMGAALERGSIIKNTGPDPRKIFATLEFFGRSHRYLICAYPPFLKHLADLARDSGFDLSGYRMAALVGGEGMSEGLRDYLSPHFNPLFSGYGASDVEIGLAGETPLSVALRRFAAKDDGVRRALFAEHSRLPMLFQYNPFEYHVSTTPDSELIYTITRPGVLSPVIAYNLHDEGGVATMPEMSRRLASAGVSLRELIRRYHGTSRAPFIWVYGRKDSTVSVMGANIYPEDIEHAVYLAPELAALTRSFCLGLTDLPNGLRRATASFEVTGEITDDLTERFDRAIFDGIHGRSPDFREAYKNHPELVRPIIQLYSPGAGPFADSDWRIKQRRLISQERNA